MFQYKKDFEGYELTRTRIFQDPVNSSRFIRGVLLGRKKGDDFELLRMDILFYRNKHDKQPYWVVKESCLYGQYDSSFMPYHRRELFHGLLFNLDDPKRRTPPGRGLVYSYPS